MRPLVACTVVALPLALPEAALAREWTFDVTADGIPIGS